MSDDPRRYGVTLAEIADSLASEVARGRGPGSPERLAQEEAERAAAELKAEKEAERHKGRWRR